MLPNHYKWKNKELTHTGNIVRQILHGRGIEDQEEMKKFLYPDRTQLHSPYLLGDMDQAVERIKCAKLNQEHIAIYGDYDVDGVTSTSILYMFLKEEGYDVSYYIPNRQEEGYGLNKEAIDKIRQYAQLIITVDTGIAANEEVAHARALGLDVIITDHHECQEVLPDAYCILNPKRPDTHYPFSGLAGVGVTFKLIHALALESGNEDKIWRYIDIVALGTVADVVPLEGENRIITSLGFKQMEKTEHVGLKALLDVLQLKEFKITSNVIGYQLGPRINAAGRISDAKIGVELLITKDVMKAKEIAAALDEENRKRQEMEATILEEAEKYIEAYVNVKEDPIIVVAGKEWHHGVIGIVASRIMGRYYKPTIVLTLEDGVYSGSARSVEGFSIFEALCEVKQHLVRFGGHEMAAGLSLNEASLEGFVADLTAYGRTHLTRDLLTPKLQIDLELSPDEITLELCDDLERMEPFGAGNPAPVFCVRGELQYAQTLGQEDKHLKISLQKGHAVIQGIGFSKGYLMDYLTEGEEILVACELSKNCWNNRVSVQMRIVDLMSTPEVCMQSQYYTSLYHRMKEPVIQDKSEIELLALSEPITSTDQLAVYTEEGFRALYQALKFPKKGMTKNVEVCYNEICEFKEGSTILVNPIGDPQHLNVKNYDWNFMTSKGYYCTVQSLGNHEKQISKMVPSYADCKGVYKLMRSHLGQEMSLHKAVQLLATYQMTEYKLLQALDIFKELGLLDYDLIEDKINYKLLNRQAKTQLECSDRYRHLQQFAKCMSTQS